MTSKNTNKEEKDITKVEVNLPSCIQIELVQGNELRNYEIFFSLSSLSLSTAVGFWTGYATSDPRGRSLFWSAMAFTILAILSGFVAFYYRKKMYSGTVKKVATLDKFN